jgi:hypothetical protein
MFQDSDVAPCLHRQNTNSDIRTYKQCYIGCMQMNRTHLNASCHDALHYSLKTNMHLFPLTERRGRMLLSSFYDALQRHNLHRVEAWL